MKNLNTTEGAAYKRILYEAAFAHVQDVDPSIESFQYNSTLECIHINDSSYGYDPLLDTRDADNLAKWCVSPHHSTICGRSLWVLDDNDDVVLSWPRIHGDELSVADRRQEYRWSIVLAAASYKLSQQTLTNMENFYAVRANSRP